MAERIEYDVSVDASDAQRELRRLGQEGERAGRDLAEGLRSAGSAGASIEKVANSLDDVVDILQDVGSQSRSVGDQLVADANAEDTALRQAATAADSLRAALGEAAEKFDVDKAVGELHKMGLGFDEIEGDAEQLAASLKKVDEIEMRRVNDGVTTTRKSMGELRDTSDQSRSVLANLAGNAAQDLGEMGGVVGSLGVGIGQLAEYAVDGNISLNNLAKVAGPMAALSGALLLVQTYMSQVARIDAWRKEQVEGYSDAVERVGEGVGAIAEHLENVAGQAFEAETGLTNFMIGGAEIPNVAAAFGVLGVTFEELAEVIHGGEAELTALEQTFRDAGHTQDTYGTALEYVAEQQRAYATATADSDAEAKFFTSTVEGLNRKLSELRDEDVFSRMIPQWDALAEAMRDGRIETEAEVLVIERLAEAFGITTDEVIAYGQQRLDEKLAAEAEAEENLRDVVEETAQARRDATDSLREYARGLDEAALRSEAFATASDQLRELSDLDSAMQLGDIADSADSLAEALKKAREEGVEIAGIDLVPDSLSEVLSLPDELRPVTDAIAGLADAVGVQLAEAFEFGGAGVVRAAADDLRGQLIPQLQEMGLEVAEIDQILAALGLREEDIEVRIRVSGEQQARNILDTLMSTLEGLVAPEHILRIAAKAETDPIAALQDAVALLETQGIEIPVELRAILDQLTSDIEGYEPPEGQPVGFGANLNQADSEVEDWAGEQRDARDIDVDADTSEAKRGTDEFTAKKRGTTVDVDVATLLAAAVLTTFIAQPRTATISAEVLGASAASFLLELAARDRTSTITGDARWTEANNDLNYAARDRISTIFARTVGLGARSATGAAPAGGAMGFGAARGAAPAGEPGELLDSGGGTLVVERAAPTPSITINTSVIGSPYDVERVIAKSLRRYERREGRRR